jgi:hypothetical protein
MKLMIRAVTAACVALSATPAVAAGGLVLEANGARAQERWGGELGVGYGFGAGGFKLRPMIGAFLYRGDNDRYYTDTFSNGQSRCRDRTNGQFADDANCENIDAEPYGRVEAVYAIPLVAEVGAGVRISEEKARPYGTVAFSASKLRIKANLGPKYVAAGLQLGF